VYPERCRRDAFAPLRGFCKALERKVVGYSIIPVASFASLSFADLERTWTSCA
jgi:hypothetical protein